MFPQKKKITKRKNLMADLLVEKETKEVDKKIPIKILIHNIGNLTQEFEKDIHSDFTLLDFLKFLLGVKLSSELSSFSLFNLKDLKKTTINIQNSTTKLINFIDEKNTVNLYERGCLFPKNDLLKAKYIVKIYDSNLQDTTNLDDICCINHARIGEWIGFGKGKTSVPIEDDNRLINIVFIKYKNINTAYNLHCLLMTLNPTSDLLLIPHLNLQVNSCGFITRLNSSLAIKDDFNIVDITDILI